MEKDKEYALQMAETIWRTLFWSLKPTEVLSWGISKRTVTTYEKMPALKLRVNGMIHKGSVVIAYNETYDFYEVYLLDKSEECVQSIKEVYADELGSRIDEVIERPKNVTDAEYRTKTFSELLKAI